VVAAQLNLNDKSNIDGGVSSSPLTPLGTQSLSDITGDTRSAHLHAPADDSGDLTARGQGALIEDDWFIRASGQTSVNSLGDILCTNSIVNVRGVGTRHSGKYYVASVHHTIDPSAHYMQFELIRNGWGNQMHGEHTALEYLAVTISKISRHGFRQSRPGVRGRFQVKVLAVLGPDLEVWAMPAPYADGVGFIVCHPAARV
jgi:hypothetical protein